MNAPISSSSRPIATAPPAWLSTSDTCASVGFCSTHREVPERPPRSRRARIRRRERARRDRHRDGGRTSRGRQPTPAPCRRTAGRRRDVEPRRADDLGNRRGGIAVTRDDLSGREDEPRPLVFSDRLVVAASARPQQRRRWTQRRRRQMRGAARHPNRGQAPPARRKLIRGQPGRELYGHAATDGTPVAEPARQQSATSRRASVLPADPPSLTSTEHARRRAERARGVGEELIASIEQQHAAARRVAQHQPREIRLASREANERDDGGSRCLDWRDVGQRKPDIAEQLFADRAKRRLQTMLSCRRNTRRT